MFSVKVSVRVRVRVSVRYIVRFRHFQVQKIRRSARPHFTRGRLLTDRVSTSVEFDDAGVALD